MGLAELRRKIENELHGYFHEAGFTYKPSWREYCKQEGDLLYSFYPLITTWSRHLSIDNHAYIKYPKFEKLFKKMCKGYPDILLGSSIGHIANSPDGREYRPPIGHDIFIMLGDEQQGIQDITSQFELVAVQFYKKFQTVDHIVEHYLSEPYGVSVYQSKHLMYLKGILLAKLFRQEKYGEMGVRFDKLVQEKLVLEEYKNDYFELRKHIDSGRNKITI